MCKSSEYQKIKSRIEEDRRFIQVVMGARQIGKSTVVKQVPKSAFIIGEGGISAEEFLSMDINTIF